jgi:hypothetical protein
MWQPDIKKNNVYPRDLYAMEALRYVPQLLTLIDRNWFSPNYGCLDREYWHYKTADFPCGMSQELVLALALLYRYRFPGSPFYEIERIRELAIASIGFAMRSSHRDGSCDEYYPFERALGATSFSLYACTESYLILGLKNSDFERFFRKRGGWLLKNPEIGILANHEAKAAVGLFNIYLITGEKIYREGADKKVQKALRCQSDEGWFKEYDGCDPGYHTWTIDFLANYFKKTGDDRLLPPLAKATEFASYFIHPDGSFGGEYGSRNSFNFYPHGFEILGKHLPLATHICDGYLKGILRGKRAYLDENRIFSHHMCNYLQAYLDFQENRLAAPIREDFEKFFPEAGLFVAKKNDYYAVISLKKGGVVKLFRHDQNIYSDTGFIGRLSDGRIAVSHLMDHKHVAAGAQVFVQGRFSEVKYHQPTRVKFIVFRLFLFFFGAIPRISKIVRKILQRMLIVGKKNIPISYRREFLFEDGLSIIDTITLEGKEYFRDLAIGSDHTSIYTAVSNCYQESMLHSWIDLNPYVEDLKKNKRIIIQRKIR